MPTQVPKSPRSFRHSTRLGRPCSRDAVRVRSHSPSSGLLPDARGLSAWWAGPLSDYFVSPQHRPKAPHTSRSGTGRFTHLPSFLRTATCAISPLAQTTSRMVTLSQPRGGKRFAPGDGLGEAVALSAALVSGVGAESGLHGWPPRIRHTSVSRRLGGPPAVQSPALPSPARTCTFRHQSRHRVQPDPWKTPDRQAARWPLPICGLLGPGRVPAYTAPRCRAGRFLGRICFWCLAGQGKNTQGETARGHWTRSHTCCVTAGKSQTLSEPVSPFTKGAYSSHLLHAPAAAP